MATDLLGNSVVPKTDSSVVVMFTLWWRNPAERFVEFVVVEPVDA